ncbi:MAG TPA: glycogen debranching protein GlgX, partial [bacterium]|nr:glycogen debranching protein GlgX [bacterium]
DIIRLKHCTRHIWHCFVPELAAGQLYGYKVLGSYDPANGLRFNGYKLLLDPYAKAVTGKFRNEENLLLGYCPLAADKDMTADLRENMQLVPKGIVIDDDFDWQGDQPPDLPLEKLVIYEVHAKGFTAHYTSGVKQPGTYLGFIEKIPYLRALGINAVEFLPIHEHYGEDFLQDKGLTNYWGYNTVGFFAPEISYSTRKRPGCQVAEFKTLVRELHKAGIEVILDVVYNHSGEGNEHGPTLSFKGIDNPTYYMLCGDEAEPLRHYRNDSGCGNNLNANHPAVLRLIMDSLRYWVEVMHVDGFRFDLASVLGREEGNFQKGASFFDCIAQDPVLSRVKLIAEPWDIGTYQVGNFPVDWSEWNGKFRDTMRKFIKGDAGLVRDFGKRITGSSDLFGDDGRHAYNSINFITCHDGFTLHDLVAYNQKHNDANRENNRDGSNDNNSWNCGHEGETHDHAINRLRRQLAKNHLCALLLSVGTPMLLGGDEFFRTQRGNNNTYCQDNDLSWFNWHLLEKNREIWQFCKRAIDFRQHYSVFQRRKFLEGLGNDTIADITWYAADGTMPDWRDRELRTICFEFDGREAEHAPRNYHLYFIYNADWRPMPCKLPCLADGKKWFRVIDTARPYGQDFLEHGREEFLQPNCAYAAPPRSVVMLLGK